MATRPRHGGYHRDRQPAAHDHVRPDLQAPTENTTAVGPVASPPNSSRQRHGVHPRRHGRGPVRGHQRRRPLLHGGLGLRVPRGGTNRLQLTNSPSPPLAARRPGPHRLRTSRSPSTREAPVRPCDLQRRGEHDGRGPAPPPITAARRKHGIHPSGTDAGLRAPPAARSRGPGLRARVGRGRLQQLCADYRHRPEARHHRQDPGPSRSRRPAPRPRTAASSLDWSLPGGPGPPSPATTCSIARTARPIGRIGHIAARGGPPRSAGLMTTRNTKCKCGHRTRVA